ncbi:DUF411 domain-containing protein [Aliigemmobacter aestuarii]|uniref:DUF411 domain-containing protein n=1 Tax=Aliigemmobacter aestuarii TaxID=1445661 RepID=A0A4S3MTD9_9RHOB|nr:DUF411 domain-containing protein [Gemmobacter aestuarii]THD84761.1 DUF411 domain-containing protein [Gemmobacter aestuarii]
MNHPLVSRRHLLVGGAAVILAGAAPALARAAAPAIHVVKDPDCGCCGAWIDILAQEGFGVTTEHLGADALQAFKRENGIPPSMASCHTARIEGYVIEGHVPVADIRRLLEERPDAVGLAVPGMPYGAPGMGPEDERDAYDVHLILRDGRTRVFASYKAA